jgi:hypothetical protein
VKNKLQSKKKVVIAQTEVPRQHLPGETEKTNENLLPGSRYPGLDSNQALPEYKL